MSSHMAEETNTERNARKIREGLVVKPIKRKYAYTRRIKNGESV